MANTLTITAKRYMKKGQKLYKFDIEIVKGKEVIKREEFRPALDTGDALSKLKSMNKHSEAFAKGIIGIHKIQEVNIKILL